MLDKEFWSQGDETPSYSTFCHALSYSIDFRALSLLGIRIFQFRRLEKKPSALSTLWSKPESMKYKYDITYTFL